MGVNQYARTALLLGESAIEKLKASRVAVFGVGGVGGYVVEALARSGVGTLDLIDHDKVSLTNLNRQIIATHDTIGQYKVDVAEERIHAIDPSIKVNKYPCFYLPDKRNEFDFTQWDYVVDCVDTVTAKLDIIEEAQRCNIPVISSMGCGNRVDPSKLELTDIYSTKNDPLARVMRYECRKRGIEKLKVVCSTEMPLKPLKEEASKDEELERVPGSTAFVPSAAGLLCASVVVRELTAFDPAHRGE